MRAERARVLLINYQSNDCCNRTDAGGIFVCVCDEEKSCRVAKNPVAKRIFKKLRYRYGRFGLLTADWAETIIE